MAGSKDFKLAFGVDVSELASGLANAQAAVAEAATGMRESLAAVTEGFTLIGEAMAGLTVALAGGAAFSEAIKSTVQGALSARDMGTQLGITASQASVLRVALGETGVSQEAVTAASARITRTLSTNEDGFKSLGVATRDSNGNFRNTLDIMVDVNSKLAEFKSGTDRNVEAQKIYGRSWQEVAAALRLTHAAFGEAQERAASLGLVIGARGVADAEAYQKSMAGVGDVFEAMRKVIAESLLPSLTATAQWFGSIGPSVIEATKAAMQALVGVFQTFKVIVLDAAQYLTGFFQEMGTGILTVASVWDRAMNFDFTGAKAAFNEGWAAMQQIAVEHFQAIKKIGEDAQAAINQVGAQQQNETPLKPNPAGKPDTDQDAAALKQQMQALEQGLAFAKITYEQEQEAHGSMLQYSKEQEAEYWRNVLANTKLSADQRAAIYEKLAATQAAISKQSFEALIAQLKEEESAHAKNAAERLALAKKEADEIGAAYGYTGPQFEAAQKHLTEVAQQATQQQAVIEEAAAAAIRDKQLAALQGEEAIAKERLAAKAISAQQYVAIEEQLENKLYETKLQAMQKQEAIATTGDDPAKLAKVLAEEETLMAQHQAKMRQLQQQGALDTSKLWTTVFSSLNTGMTQAVSSMLRGTQSITQGFRSMVSSVIESLANLMAKFIEQAALDILLNKKSILSSASSAAAAAANSAAQIPVIGWLLAPAAAAATYAAAIAFPSAEGGYDIPRGINPMTQLHGGEMVLPATLADTIRGLTGDGFGGFGSGRGSRGGGDTHLYVSATDARSFKKQLIDHSSDLYKELARGHRHGNWRP